MAKKAFVVHLCFDDQLKNAHKRDLESNYGQSSWPEQINLSNYYQII